MCFPYRVPVQSSDVDITSNSIDLEASSCGGNSIGTELNTSCVASPEDLLKPSTEGVSCLLFSLAYELSRQSLGFTHCSVTHGKPRMHTESCAVVSIR